MVTGGANNEWRATYMRETIGKGKGWLTAPRTSTSDGESAPDAVLWPRETWEWYGASGHLIVGHDCRFHLATAVGPWWISTVGEWLPDSSSWDIYAKRVGGIPPELRGDAKRAWFIREVGYIDVGAGDSKFETMVFRAGDRCMEEACGQCGAPYPDSWSELQCERYMTQGDAMRGHYEACEYWSRQPEDAGPYWEDGDE